MKIKSNTIILFTVLFSGCVSFFKLHTESRYNIISDFDKEFNFDTCLLNTINILVTIRVFENKFLTSMNKLSKIDI